MIRFNARLVIFNYDEEGERGEEKITAMRPRRWVWEVCADISGQTREREGGGIGEKKIAFAGYRIIRKRFQFEDEKSFAASNKCMAEEKGKSEDARQLNRKRIWMPPDIARAMSLRVSPRLDRVRSQSYNEPLNQKPRQGAYALVLKQFN